jgi:hypothetical protein
LPVGKATGLRLSGPPKWGAEALVDGVSGTSAWQGAILSGRRPTARQRNF